MTQERHHLIFVLRVFSIALLVVGLHGAAFAADDRDRDDATLVGTWRQNITFPGVPIEFFDLIVFSEDGTVTERFGSLFDGPSLSISIGVWKKVGHNTFAVTMENFADTDRNGLFDVRFRIRSTFYVIDRDTVTATSMGEPLSVDGTTQLGPSFSSTAQGTRMHVIPE